MNAGIGDNWLKREGVGQFADSRGWVMGGGLEKNMGVVMPQGTLCSMF